MRAVIYARYSTDLQSPDSIADQVRLCHQRADREGWAVVGTYADRAISGATRLRPQYQKLLDDVREGIFDVVIAEALDRLTRDQEDVAALFKQLSFRGIKIVTLSEGEISELHVGLKGTMNALFLKDLGQKTWRGLEGRVRKGRSGGGLCFGYDLKKELDHNNEPIRGGRVVNSIEAEVIRRIFSDYASGRSPRAVAKTLNAEHIAGPGGRPWSDTTIRGHHLRRTGILHNELYIGRLIWNKQHYLKDPTSGRRLAGPNPENKWILMECPELRVLEQPLWDTVQARLAAIRETPGVKAAMEKKFWLKRRSNNLLTGLAKCGVCGGDLAPSGQDYLACGAARRQGTCGNRRSIRRPVLEGLILDALQNRLMDPDTVKTFVDEFRAEVNRQRRELEAGAGLKRRELGDVIRKLDNLVEAIANGLKAGGLQAKFDEFEARKLALEQELAGTELNPVRLLPNVGEIYRQKVAALQESLTNPSLRSRALEILRGLIEQVVVHPEQAGGFTIELVGEIASMLTLSSGQEGLKSEPYRSSVKVVAGTCNHRQFEISALI